MNMMYLSATITQRVCLGYCEELLFGSKVASITYPIQYGDEGHSYDCLRACLSANVHVGYVLCLGKGGTHWDQPYFHIGLHSCREAVAQSQDLPEALHLEAVAQARA